MANPMLLVGITSTLKWDFIRVTRLYLARSHRSCVLYPTSSIIFHPAVRDVFRVFCAKCLQSYRVLHVQTPISYRYFTASFIVEFAGYSNV
jgi:hypothetical protein